MPPAAASGERARASVVRDAPVPSTHGPQIRPRDFGLVVLGAVAWGTSGVVGSVLARTESMSMLTVAASRLVVGGVVVLLVLAAVRRLGSVPRTWTVLRRVLLTAGLAATYQSCYFVAVGFASVSVPTLVALGAAPVIVATSTAIGARRRPPVQVLVALSLALAGLILLVGRPSGSGAVVGVLLALVAAASFATMTMLNRAPVAGLEPAALTGMSFMLGGLALAPVAELVGGPFSLPHTPSGWLLLGFLGAVPTAAAYTAYFAGLRTVPATTAALLALLEPLTGAVVAALVLGDRLGAGGLVGGILLATAVVVLRPRP